MLYRRTQNLNASFYIYSLNWYIWSNCEMWQLKIPAEEVGVRYRRDVQQYSLILIYPYGTLFFKWRKNEGGSKILNWGRGTLRFRVLLCCVNELEYFWALNNFFVCDSKINLKNALDFSALKWTTLQFSLFFKSHRMHKKFWHVVLCKVSHPRSPFSLVCSTVNYLSSLVCFTIFIINFLWLML